MSLMPSRGSHGLISMFRVGVYEGSLGLLLGLNTARAGRQDNRSHFISGRDHQPNAYRDPRTRSCFFSISHREPQARPFTMDL